MLFNDIKSDSICDMWYVNLILFEKLSLRPQNFAWSSCWHRPRVLAIPTRTALPLATTSTLISQPQIPTTGLQYVDDQLVYVNFHTVGGFNRGNVLTLGYDSLGRPVLPWTPQ